MKNCKNCFIYQHCKDTFTSWVILFIGLLATISVRVVNLFLDFSPFWAKVFWYIGVGGFFIYFLYKFKQDRNIQKEILKRELVQKLSREEIISFEDREFLKTLFCKFKSNKDAINYFFIFFTSGLALVLGIYLDFIKK